MPGFCPQCGRQVSESAAFCEGCGTNLRGGQTPSTSVTAPVGGAVAIKHDIPKCLACGTITKWRVEPALLPRHFAVGCMLLLFFGAGLIYWFTVALIRAHPATRAKICPKCGGRNMWTFMY